MARLFAILTTVFTAVVSADGVDQLMCTDDGCSQDCQLNSFTMNTCLETTAGGAMMFLQCDASGVNFLDFDTPDCSDQGSPDSMAVAQCLPLGDSSGINTCESAKAFNVTSQKRKLPATPFRTKKAETTPNAASAVDQLVCTDTGCSQDCQLNSHTLNECGEVTGGGSLMWLQCDSDGVTYIFWDSVDDCSGQGTTETMSVAQCLVGEAGESFINTCESMESINATKAKTPALARRAKTVLGGSIVQV
jgi:hypothetical protein